MIAPLVLAMPWPVRIEIAPPVWTVLSPAVTITAPPTPLVPLPTVMLKAPPLPPVDAPDPIEMEPVDPELEVPELNTNRPLRPLVPAFDERMLMAPLEVAIPWPLMTPTAPPVFVSASPEVSLICPPTPLVPRPTVRLT